ncbi:MAG: hypothetical protein JXA67_12020 [Micromonosporaceae bacterium]|nr:hypothetical protein [Micromonosporaceae bacterium]
MMRNLLTGQAPLRGQAGLELQVATFDYRTAREFWDIADPRTATLVHAVCGGTPAYRDLVGADAPTCPENSDAWVTRAILNPASPLHGEARYPLPVSPTISVWRPMRVRPFSSTSISSTTSTTSTTEDRSG